MDARSTISGSLKDLRQKAIRLYRERAVILVIGNHPSRLPLREVNRAIEVFEALDARKELKAQISELRAIVAEMREDFKIVASQEDLLQAYARLEAVSGADGISYTSVDSISELTKFYEGHGFPPHARIGLDPQGISINAKGDFEVHRLETSLYEDMCAMFNLAIEINPIRIGLSPTELSFKLSYKRHLAALRSAVTTAFYFVEAYLNALAFDFLHSTAAQSIGRAQRIVLTEWDADKNRTKNVTTRDKLVKYPMIIKGLPSPPWDEATCPELKYFVEVAKLYRDSIVHASPKVSASASFDKEELFIGMSYDQAAKIVDTAVFLVRRMNITLLDCPPDWLFERGPDGKFPDQAFS